MRLDMYAIRLKTKPATPVDFDSDGSEGLHYWRKHPNLHGWMEQLYREKGGCLPNFNCDTVELTADDIYRLEQAVLNDGLPQTEGFFFGVSTPENRAHDLEFIEKARLALAEGWFVGYTSWW